MTPTGYIHAEQYVLITVKKNGGTAVLQVKNNSDVGFVDMPLNEGAQVIFLRPCEYKLVLTGSAKAGMS